MTKPNDSKSRFYPVKLTELQQKHLASIEWLVSDNRAEGKTFLLAVAFIRKALNNLGQWVYIFDHFAEHKGGTDNLMFLIRTVLAKDKRLLNSTEFRQTSFRVNSTISNPKSND